MAAADGDTPEFYNILNNDNVSGFFIILCTKMVKNTLSQY